MYLRKLKQKDAPLMLGWMHDENVTQWLHAPFASKTLQDAREFIRKSRKDTDNLHLAISSDEDEYMGTVSLKQIENGSAEFAITVRSEAMGQGYAWFGMREILKKAFDELGLETVLWCVSENNVRAVRFYEKHRFKAAADVPEDRLEPYKEAGLMKWYAVRKDDPDRQSILA